VQLHTENGSIAHEAIPAISSTMEIALKNSMIASNMKTDGTSPNHFYCPYDPNTARQVLGNHMCQTFTRRMVSLCLSYCTFLRVPSNKPSAFHQGKTMPYVGIHQAIRFCHEGNAFLSVDAVLDFFNIENTPPDSNRQEDPIPILDERSNTLCGVRVDLTRPITDARAKEEIEKALRKLTIHMKYVKPNDEEREEGKQGHVEHQLLEIKANIHSSPFLI
jgi:hypothetical protein